MFQLALIELVDRYCIAKLKFKKLGNNSEEVEFYTKQMNQFNLSHVIEEIEQLTTIHGEIWDMEDDFKKCVVELKYPMDEIGRRAIKIRDINIKRYELKNRIAEKLNDPIREKKKYYNQVIG
jgi:hypothetical protein